MYLRSEAFFYQQLLDATYIFGSLIIWTTVRGIKLPFAAGITDHQNGVFMTSIGIELSGEILLSLFIPFMLYCVFKQKDYDPLRNGF